MRIDPEGQVAQNLGTDAIAQTYMLESDHVPLPARNIKTRPGQARGACRSGPAGRPEPRLRPLIAARRPFHPAFTRLRGGQSRPILLTVEAFLTVEVTGSRWFPVR